MAVVVAVGFLACVAAADAGVDDDVAGRAASGAVVAIVLVVEPVAVCSA